MDHVQMQTQGGAEKIEKKKNDFSADHAEQMTVSQKSLNYRERQRYLRIRMVYQMIRSHNGMDIRSVIRR